MLCNVCVWLLSDVYMLFVCGVYGWCMCCELFVYGCCMIVVRLLYCCVCVCIVVVCVGMICCRFVKMLLHVLHIFVDWVYMIVVCFCMVVVCVFVVNDVLTNRWMCVCIVVACVVVMIVLWCAFCMYEF